MPPMPADTVPVHCHKLHAHPETTRPSIRARSFSIAGGEERERGFWVSGGGGWGAGRRILVVSRYDLIHPPLRLCSIL